MKVELIPVIEIFNSNENIKSPDLGPFWEYENEWENYNHLCNIAAGFSEFLKPYLKGSSLYAIEEISDIDLLQTINKEIEMQQTEENNGIEDLVSSFNGGYVLKIDDKSVYFPQCCSSLADIRAWENLLIGITKSFYAGHPYPRITENLNKIRFDFIDIQVRENFAPPISLSYIEIEKSKLEFAIIEANKLLQIFADRLKKINHMKKLNIKNIDRILIFGETE
ncbi:hypothetical protein [Flavobacterium foetidum]|uniref:hypothetical protein n=1 Tax=Flavobacterium foetidum TaxID=2026681 RepID=UPI001074EA09|nr:hypothetical protein [Flavobacterium foetidum]KAF2516071.1 hypothetical protein E0W73_07395 [Flavobacterium foetidum]